MIDWERVEELREEVGPEEFPEVVELFLEEVQEVIDRLKSAPDPNNYEQDLHFLKGSALNLGFSVFGELCQAGETAAANGQAQSVDLAPILSCYDASRQSFLSGVSANAA